MMIVVQSFLAILLLSTISADVDKNQDANKQNELAKKYGTIIGIDLGTTYSCVGIFKNGRVEIIPNDQGNRITPSYVAFTNQGKDRLIGDAAKNQLTSNPKNTIYDIKRIIGREFTDPVVQKDANEFSFKVVESNQKPYIEVLVNGEPKQFAPEEISAMVLTKMKSIAEGYLGHNVTHAVVTVPAYFNDAQRQATKDAGTIAGLTVLRIINEPTAAAIAYGLDKNAKSKEHQILVFDLGGGTFDVSLLTIDQGVFEVMATNGDTHLGGEDFDTRVVNYFAKMLKKKSGKDIKKDQRAWQKMRREVEKAKRSLSSVLSTRIEIESLIDGEDFSETLSRAKFEELNMDLFKSTLNPVIKVLEDAKIKKSDVSEIVLVGGSTRIPKVQELVSKFFDNKQPNKGINPDEAVAYGAAVQAGVLGGDSSTGDLLLLDVCPLTLGMELDGGVMATLIPRNTPIPTIKRDVFTTVVDNQNNVITAVYEGERSMAKDNHFLGQFDLVGIPPAPRGRPQIEVTFEIDANGILKVSAEDKASGSKNQIVITNDKNRLKQADIDKMLKDAEKFKDQDLKVKQRIEAKSELEQYMYSLKTQLNDKSQLGGKMSAEDKTKCLTAISNVVSWIDKNPEATKEEFLSQQQQLQQLIQPFINKLYDDSPKGRPSPDSSKESTEKTEL